MPVTSGLGKLRQKYCNFEATLVCEVSLRPDQAAWQNSFLKTYKQNHHLTSTPTSESIFKSTKSQTSKNICDASQVLRYETNLSLNEGREKMQHLHLKGYNLTLERTAWQNLEDMMLHGKIQAPKGKCSLGSLRMRCLKANALKKGRMVLSSLGEKAVVLLLSYCLLSRTAALFLSS